MRFVRVASRYEEEVRGQTTIGFPSASFAPGRLGSGIVFGDDIAGQKELVSNAARIEGWMKTKMYEYFQAASIGWFLHATLSDVYALGRQEGASYKSTRVRCGTSSLAPSTRTQHARWRSGAHSSQHRRETDGIWPCGRGERRLCISMFRLLIHQISFCPICRHRINMGFYLSASAFCIRRSPFEI